MTIPTLVLDGGASDTFLHTGADALAELLPNAERRTLEGQTHDVAASVLSEGLAIVGTFDEEAKAQRQFIPVAGGRQHAQAVLVGPARAEGKCPGPVTSAQDVSDLIEGIYRRDYAVLQGGTLLIGAVVMTVNLLVDVTYGLINPRIRHTR